MDARDSCERIHSQTLPEFFVEVEKVTEKTTFLLTKQGKGVGGRVGTV